MLVYQDTLFVAASRTASGECIPRSTAPKLDDSTSSSVALGLFEGSTSSAATADGVLSQRQGNRWQPLSASNISSTADLSDTDGPLWVASHSGLRVLGTDPPPPPREPRANFFFDMAQTPNGHLWVASVPKDNLPAFGLYEFDGEGWTTHTTNTDLSSNTVSALETDDEGLLWVGHWGRGIDVRDCQRPVAAPHRQQLGSRRHQRRPLCRHQRHRPRRQRCAVDCQRPKWARRHGWVAAPTGRAQQPVELWHVLRPRHDQNRHWPRRPEVDWDGARRLLPLRRWRHPF